MVSYFGHYHVFPKHLHVCSMKPHVKGYKDKKENTPATICSNYKTYA